MISVSSGLSISFISFTFNFLYRIKIYIKNHSNKQKNKKIILSSEKLFQIPFTLKQFDKYKKLTKYNCCDCLLNVLTSLKLRNYFASKVDSMKIYKEGIIGVEVSEAANYLSTIFGANIQVNYRETYPNFEIDLKEGYATFVCFDFWNIFLPFSYFSYGHFFIIYKKNNTIYFYDPSRSKKWITQNINDFYRWYNYSKNYITYDNTLQKKGHLIKTKLSTMISYD